MSKEIRNSQQHGLSQSEIPIATWSHFNSGFFGGGSHPELAEGENFTLNPLSDFYST
jgi:hypothetical protein